MKFFDIIILLCFQTVVTIPNLWSTLDFSFFAYKSYVKCELSGVEFDLIFLILSLFLKVLRLVFFTNDVSKVY
jgi:hypothetical protein